MSRPRMTEAQEIARTVELRALYAAKCCIARGCTEYGAFGVGGRSFCREHLPEDSEIRARMDAALAVAGHRQPAEAA